jgi:hypothetical protein
MRIYWTLNSMPELQGLSRQGRHWALRCGFQRAIHDRRTIRTFLVAVLALALGGGLLGLALDLILVHGVVRHVCESVYACASGFALSQLIMEAVGRAIREEQQGHRGEAPSRD